MDQETEKPERQGFFSRLFRRKRKPTAAVLRLAGAIAAESRFGGGLNHRAVADQIEAAFKVKRVKAVALEINSPGGAPAQSALIARHIQRLAKEKDIPVYAFCEDAAASGGYILACAAQEIYADEYSVVGSIGVVSAGFGFNELMEKAGVDRRLYTAGVHKRLQDPFSPEDPEGAARLKELMKHIHERFIDFVKESRGDRLKPDETPLFEGDVWVGEQALPLGLIDGVAHLKPKLQELLGEEVQLRRIEPKRRGLLARFGFGAAGEAVVDRAAAQVDARTLWARCGL